MLGVGCGEGFVLDEAAPGIAGTRCPGATLVRGDACALLFRDWSLDLVVCPEVLEPLSDPAPALRERRRLARAGRLLSVAHEPFLRFGPLLRGGNVAPLGPPKDHRRHRGAREFAAFRRRELAGRVHTGTFPGLLVYGTV
jgi:SAM-dependent methyltransferase